MENDDEGGWTKVVSKKKTVPKNENASINPTVVQDWDRVVIHGKPTHTIKKAAAPRVNFTPDAVKMQKLDAGEIVKPKILSIESRQELIKGRVAKGLNQEKVAQALAIPANLYKDIENGKTIPQYNILNKINSFLGTHAKLT